MEVLHKAENPTHKGFAMYGDYEISDSIELVFPNHKINISKNGEKMFEYLRVDKENKEIRKIIPTDTGNLKIIVAPIRPLNYPSRRTEHVMLKFDSEFHIPSNSDTSLYVRCPIEVGIFLNQNGLNSLDCFSCNESESRFSHYGKPDGGVLCKYAKTPISESHVQVREYMDALMQVKIKNSIGEGHGIKKLMFHITDFKIYYKDSQCLVDSLTSELRKRGHLNIHSTRAELIQTEFTESPVWEPTTHTKKDEFEVE